MAGRARPSTVLSTATSSTGSIRTASASHSRRPARSELPINWLVMVTLLLRDVDDRNYTV